MRVVVLLLAAVGAGIVALPASAQPAGRATAALTADFSCAPSCSVIAGTKVTFTAASNATTPAYSWDLNADGVFDDATGAVANDTFTKAGTYPISLRVEDTSTKQVVEVTHDVTVTPRPTAVLQVMTAAPTSGSPVTFSGGGSQAGTGHIISYDWDFAGDGHFRTSTGTNPIAHFTFTTGTHTVGLRVATSAGVSATTTSTFNVLSPSARGIAGCNSELDLGRVRLLANCIAPMAGGAGYTLTGSQLDLNGLTLETRDGASSTFNLSTNSSGDFLSGPAVNVVMQNTPVGDIVVGSYDLTAHPIDLTAAAHASAVRARSREPDDPPPNLGIRLFTLAAGHTGHDCVGSMDPTCCPPPAVGTTCAMLPGGFPFAGNVSVYLDPGLQAVVDLNVSLNLPTVGFSATGELEVVIDLAGGLHADALQFTVPMANLRFFDVRHAQFQYYFPDYADPVTGDTSKADSWEAMATVAFGPMHLPAIMGDLAFKQGAFDHGAVTLTVPGGIPLFVPAILLNRIGASIYSTPFGFGGLLGASIARVFELSLQFAYQEPSPTSLGYVGGMATLDYQGPGADPPVTIATAEGEAFTDGFFDAALAIDISIPFNSDADHAVLHASGNVSFWDESSTGRFEGTGDVHFRIRRWIDVEAAAIYNNAYLAGCAAVDGFGVAGWDHYSDEVLGGGFFGWSNCHDQLLPYHTHPVTAHCGPFTPGGCIHDAPLADVPTGREAHPANLVRLPVGLPGEEIRVTSKTGTPIVQVTSPDGHVKFTTPAQAGTRVVRAGSYIAAIGPNPHQLLIFLKHPAAGTWKLAPAGDTGRITKIESGDDVPPPVVHTSVKAGRGRSRVLSYRIGNFAAGSTIRFVERGRDTTHVIGTAKSASGTITFFPEQGMSRRRRIEADLIAVNGSPQTVTMVGRYTAPPPVRGGRPTHLRFKRHGGNAVLTWGPAANARFYDVVVRGSDGRVNQFLVRARSARRVTVLRTLPFDTFTATVRAEGGPDSLAGPAAKAKLGKQKTRQRRLDRSAPKLKRLPGALVP